MALRITCALLVLCCALGHASPVSDTVHISSGNIQGKLGPNARVFRGIPFGTLKVCFVAIMSSTLQTQSYVKLATQNQRTPNLFTLTIFTAMGRSHRAAELDHPA